MMIYVDQSNGDGGTSGYGYKYDFKTAYLMMKQLYYHQKSTPTVFELKNPNTNIQGRVR